MKTESFNEIQYVEKFFHGYAHDFDSIYGHTQGRSFVDKIGDLFRSSMKKRFEETLKNVANDNIQSVLDIGCGPGHYTFEFLKMGKKVLALDIAEGMLKLAREKTEKYQRNNSLHFVQASYLEYNVPQKYDASVLTGFFDYVKDPLPVFEKLKKDTAKEIYMSFPKKGGFLAWQRKVRYKYRKCPLYLYSKKDLEHLLRKAGWETDAEIIDLKRDFFVKITL